jgi:ABC-type lipoprotein export system ATPase subunit
MSFGIDKCKMQSICRGHYEHLEYITQEGEIIKNLNIKENLEKQFYLRIKSTLAGKISGTRRKIIFLLSFLDHG